MARAENRLSTGWLAVAASVAAIVFAVATPLASQTAEGRRRAEVACEVAVVEHVGPPVQFDWRIVSSHSEMADVYLVRGTFTQTGTVDQHYLCAAGDEGVAGLRLTDSLLGSGEDPDDLYRWLNGGRENQSELARAVEAFEKAEREREGRAPLVAVEVSEWHRADYRSVAEPFFAAVARFHEAHERLRQARGATEYERRLGGLATSCEELAEKSTAVVEAGRRSPSPDYRIAAALTAVVARYDEVVVACRARRHFELGAAAGRAVEARRRFGDELSRYDLRP